MNRKLPWAVCAVTLLAACSGPTTEPPLISSSGHPSRASTPATSMVASHVLSGEPWLAYEDKEFRIRLVRSDGSGDHEFLPGIAGPQDNPDWSPDGQRVTFVGADPTAGPADLWTANADGSGVTKVVDCTLPCEYLDDPTWSADGASIYYSRQEPGPEVGGRLERVDVATGRVQTIVSAPVGSFVSGVQASPDGRYLVAEMVTATATDYEAVRASALTRIDLDTTPVRQSRLTQPALFAETPDWNPTGELITFNARATADSEASEIYTIRADGSGLHRLTQLSTSGGSGVQPTFTTDGLAIDFVGSAAQAGPEGFLRVSVRGGPASATFAGAPSAGPPVVGNHPRWRPVP